MRITKHSSVEIRHSVTTPAHKLRRVVDNLLFSLTSRTPITLASLGAFAAGVTFPSGTPRGWLPLYTMVVFRPDISYSAAKRKAAEQNRVISNVGIVGSALLGIASVGMASIALFHGARTYS